MTDPQLRLAIRAVSALRDRRWAELARRGEMTADQYIDVLICEDLDCDRLTDGDMHHRHYGLVTS